MEKVIRIQLDNYGYLDTNNNLPFSIIYSIADVKNLSRKNSSYSKTAYLPGTKNNNTLLGYLFDINHSLSSFNRNRKIQCRVFENDVELLKGYIQLLGVNKKSVANEQGDEIIQYEVLVFDEKMYLMDLVGDDTLAMLPLTGYNHTLSASTILQSTGNTWKDGYTYIQKYSDQTYYTVEDYQPDVYAKVYWDLIAKNKSYVWGGNFPKTQPFTKLVVPYNGDVPNISDVDIYGSSFKASMSGIGQALYTQIKAASSTTVYNINQLAFFYNANNWTPFGVPLQYNDKTNTNIGNYDAGNNFSITLNTYTVPTTGLYNFNVYFEGTYTYSASTNGWRYANNNSPPTNQTATPTQVIMTVNNVIKATKPSVTLGIPTRANIYQSGPDIIANTLYTTSFVFNEGFELPIILNSGDQVRFYYKMNQQPYNRFYNTGTVNAAMGMWGSFNALPSPSRVINSALSLSFNLNDTKSSYTGGLIKKQPLTQGSYVNIAEFVPKNVKQKDFIGAITQMFNLFFERDDIVSNQINVKTREEYYSGNTYVDWTDKFCDDLDNNIKFITELQSKKLRFSYKQDKDVANTAYSAATGYVYGEYQLNFDNDFLTGEKTIGDMLFSPTPIKDNAYNIPLPFIDSKAPKNNVRILYHKGLLTGNGITYQFNYINPSSSSSAHTISGVNWAGHFDDPYNPTLDINWGENSSVFYKGLTTYPTDNLYELYYKNYIYQINEGKLFTAFFNLNAYDIAKLRFSDKVFIKDSYFLINKIDGYNPTSDEPTKVELIKIPDGIRAIPPRRKPIPSGVYNANTDINNNSSTSMAKMLPSMNGPYIVEANNNFVSAKKAGLIFGNGNQINQGSENTLLMSSANVLLGGSKNVTILGGSGNTVTNNVENVYVFNTNNKVIKESNIAYINGAKIKDGVLYPSWILIDSGIDTVINPYSAFKENLIDSGLDVVRILGSPSPISLVDSGLDTTNQ